MTEPTWNPMRQAFDRPPTLAEFLLARVGEDETEARAVMASTEVGVDLEPLALSWEHDRDYGPTGYLCINPSRVLAEVEVQRRIVELHADGREELRYPGDDLDDEVAGMPAWCVRCTVEHEGEPWPCLTLRLLALPYADHPDYRPEWKL